MLEEYGPEIIYIKKNMADVISQLYLKSSSREINVNDQNKAGVETEIVHSSHKHS